jgi:hypothetical protein
MPAKKSNRPLPPLRVRREPPTVEEAVFAAQALTEDLEQQVEVAAGLIGLPVDDVRPHVLSAPPPPREPAKPVERAGNGVRRSAPTVVVVQRRSRATPGGIRPLENPYRPLRRD